MVALLRQSNIFRQSLKIFLKNYFSNLSHQWTRRWTGG